MKSVIWKILIGFIAVSLVCLGCGKRNPTDIDSGVGTLQLALVVPSGTQQLPIGKVEVYVTADDIDTVYAELTEDGDTYRVSINVKAGSNRKVTVKIYDLQDELLDEESRENVTVNVGETTAIEMSFNFFAPIPVYLSVKTETIDDTSAVFVWTKNHDSDFEEYMLFDALSPGVTMASHYTGSKFDQSDTTMYVYGMLPNVTFYFKLYTCDNDYCSPSNEIWVTPGVSQLDTVLYYDDGTPAYYFSIPDEYDDDLFNVRFTPPNSCTLTETKFRFYTKGNWSTPDVRIYIWDDVSGFPGAKIDSVNLAGSQIVFDDWQTIPLSINLSSGEDFHIGYTIVNESAGDTLGILSDDGIPVGTEHRSSEFYGGVWGTMYDDWGDDVNFMIRARVLCAGGKEVKLTPDLPPAPPGRSPDRIRRLYK